MDVKKRRKMELLRGMQARNKCFQKTSYSESYTGTIHQEATIEGYQYCTSLDRAFQSLISKNLNNFVLTIGCTAVAIYCKGNVGIEKFFNFNLWHL